VPNPGRYTALCSEAKKLEAGHWGKMLASALCLSLLASAQQGRGTIASAGDIYRKSSPAVVLIELYNEKGEVSATGSGFLISPDGKILTSYHVIAHTKQATVRLANGDAYDSVDVLDTDKRKDIALIKIKAVELPCLQLGKSSAVDVGDKVFSLSTPLGLLQNTLSEGIVSGIRSGDGYRYFQVSAPISHGSSGGPIFNASGQVIGLATATIEEGQNLNFVVPIDYAKGMLTSNQPRSLTSIYEPETAPEKPHITIPPAQGEHQPEAKPAASNPGEGKALAAKVVAALGGEAKLRSIQAIRGNYAFTQKAPQGDVAMTMQSIIVFPDHVHISAQGPMGDFTVVASPSVAFFSAASMGTRDLPEGQKQETLAQIKRDLIYIGQHLNDPAFVFSALGTEKIGNVDAQILDVAGSGMTVRWYVDPASGRVLRESYPSLGRSGPVQAETDLDDWKTSDGLTLPFLHKNRQNGQDASTVQFTGIQINPQVDPKLFDKPSSEAKGPH
jgi:S1-C subfamily serine protease